MMHVATQWIDFANLHYRNFYLPKRYQDKFASCVQRVDAVGVALFDIHIFDRMSNFWYKKMVTLTSLDEAKKYADDELLKDGWKLLDDKCIVMA